MTQDAGTILEAAETASCVYALYTFEERVQCMATAKAWLVSIVQETPTETRTIGATVEESLKKVLEDSIATWAPRSEAASPIVATYRFMQAATAREHYEQLFWFMQAATAREHYEQLFWFTQAATAREHYEQPLEASIQQERQKRSEELIHATFQAAREQDFEDGMESEFSRELLSLIREYGNSAMQEISYLLTYDRVNHEVSAEALRWLGRMKDAPTHAWRLWLLEKVLGSLSTRVRDGAALGLASMGDPAAIPSIRKALDRETCTELREDIAQVLERLESIRHVTLVEKDTQS